MFTLALAVLSLCFFFQAEDGIRDIGVTGVQTCALPILDQLSNNQLIDRSGLPSAQVHVFRHALVQEAAYQSLPKTRRRERLEERRVGKECRSRWSPYH